MSFTPRQLMLATICGFSLAHSGAVHAQSKALPGGPTLGESPAEQELAPGPGARTPFSALDGARPVDLATEYDMTSGRLTKLPVSWYWSKPLSFPGPHRLAFRSVCSTADSNRARCDTGMLVYGGGRTYYNNDDPDPAAHGTGSGRGSYVALPMVIKPTSYTVVVFSQLRATSRTFVEYSETNGASWTRLSGTGTIEAGGTVVKVGPLQDGDSIEVQTRRNGYDEDATQMLLFSPDNVATKRVTASENTSSSDGDPRVVIATRDWLTPSNYVLLGKKTRSSAAPAGVETRVDLAHYPLSVERSASLIDCAGGCGAALEPGRYSLYVFATIDMPVGHYTSDPRTWHLSGNMPLLNPPLPTRPYSPPDPSCPNDDRDGYGDATWYRGAPNDIAMTLMIQRRDGDGWETVGSRKIPRGAFGAAPSQGWNKFALELQVDSPGTYRVTTLKHVAGIREFEDWRSERNPEATELKLVSYNTLFASHAFDANKYRNIANLLGTRGSILPASLRVEERPEQGPFQWEADVLGMQEMIKGSDHNLPDNKYTDVVRDELDARSSLKWSYAQGRGETWSTGWGDGPGMNPIFVNNNVLPNLVGIDVFFNLPAKAHAGCTVLYPGTLFPAPPEYMECPLTESMGEGDFRNYASAAKISAWRGGDDDRPVVVFNVHLEASHGPAHFSTRLGELKTLMRVADRLLEADHGAFNRAPETAADKASPTHYQNRIVILGDWNIRAHDCGEHYWMVRALREHFGYAVDVSLAYTNSSGDLRHGMHVGAAGYGPDDVPVGYQHQSKEDPRDPPAWTPWQRDPNLTSASRFPWWAADWRDTQTSPEHVGERLSAIMLVGRGWAYDDPVLGYTVMSDSNYVSPMNPSGRGVEMYRDGVSDALEVVQPDLVCDHVGTGGVSSGPAPDASKAQYFLSYAPSYSLGCTGYADAGTAPGSAALFSDHRPMGVRLRIWSR